MSVADMLAAARAEKSGDSAAAPAPAEEAPAAAEPEPTPEPEAEAPAAPDSGGVVKVDRSSMSIADMLAYCREKDAQ